MTDHVDPFDELAALFLTEPDVVAPGNEGSTAQRTVVELAIVGHLPVRAGVWLTPYADAIACEQGPTWNRWWRSGTREESRSTLIGIGFDVERN